MEVDIFVTDCSVSCTLVSNSPILWVLLVIWVRAEFIDVCKISRRLSNNGINILDTSCATKVACRAEGSGSGRGLECGELPVKGVSSPDGASDVQSMESVCDLFLPEPVLVNCLSDLSFDCLVLCMVEGDSSARGIWRFT